MQEYSDMTYRLLWPDRCLLLLHTMHTTIRISHITTTITIRTASVGTPAASPMVRLSIETVGGGEVGGGGDEAGGGGEGGGDAGEGGGSAGKRKQERIEDW